jgi:hypothetical protein
MTETRWFLLILVFIAFCAFVLCGGVVFLDVHWTAKAFGAAAALMYGGLALVGVKLMADFK